MISAGEEDLTEASRRSRLGPIEKKRRKVCLHRGTWEQNVIREKRRRGGEHRIGGAKKTSLKRKEKTEPHHQEREAYFGVGIVERRGHSLEKREKKEE